MKRKIISLSLTLVAALVISNANSVLLYGDPTAMNGWKGSVPLAVEKNGIIMGGAVGVANAGLPTPLPEPVTIALLGIGALSDFPDEDGIAPDTMYFNVEKTKATWEFNEEGLLLTGEHSWFLVLSSDNLPASLILV